MRRSGPMLGLAAAGLTILVVQTLVLQKERVLATGNAVLLELAPADPRSLMQGDYMVLDYRVARDHAQSPGAAGEGTLVVAVGADGVARFVREHRREPLGPGEQLLRYKTRRARTQLGAEAFFFEEGTADTYAQARFGELRVTPSGASVLVGLASRSAHTA